MVLSILTIKLNCFYFAAVGSGGGEVVVVVDVAVAFVDSPFCSIGSI